MNQNPINENPNFQEELIKFEDLFEVDTSLFVKKYFPNYLNFSLNGHNIESIGTFDQMTPNHIKSMYKDFKYLINLIDKKKNELINN